MENSEITPQFSPLESELTGKQIKWGYWFASHKLLLRRIGILGLVFFDIIIFIFVFYGLLQYYFINRNQVMSMYNDLTSDKLNYEYLMELSAPAPLAVTFVEVLSDNEGFGDFVAEVNNPNNTWYVKNLTYHFVTDDFVGPTQTDFVLPLQQKFIMSLHLPIGQAVSSAQLIIDDIKWEKVAFYDDLKDKILNIEVLDPKFISENQLGGGELGLNRVEALIKNNSAYNFWDVKLKVLLYRENTLVYINEIPVRTLNSGSSYDMAFNVFNGLTRPNKVYVFPEVDILNPESFKGFDG